VSTPTAQFSQPKIMKIENSFLEGACRSFPYFPDKCDRHLARQEEMIYADLIFIIDYQHEAGGILGCTVSIIN